MEWGCELGVGMESSWDKDFGPDQGIGGPSIGRQKLSSGTKYHILDI